MMFMGMIRKLPSIKRVHLLFLCVAEVYEVHVLNKRPLGRFYHRGLSLFLLWICPLPFRKSVLHERYRLRLLRRRTLILLDQTKGDTSEKELSNQILYREEGDYSLGNVEQSYYQKRIFVVDGSGYGEQ